MISYWANRARCAAGIACALLAVPSTAATIIVTPATFNSVFAAEQGGDTLQLVGTFAGAWLRNRTFTNAVTIDATLATFTSTLSLDTIKNLTVRGGTFNISGAPDYTKAIWVRNGRNVSIVAPTVIGTAGGMGVVFAGTTGATLANGSFRGLQVASVFGSVTAGSVRGNTITGAVSDGIDIANSHGVTASYNSCSGGTPGAGVHPDCIQLWSVTGQPLQSDITVRYNKATGATQGFTAFDSMGGELRAQIIHNTVNTSYPQGIACYSCVDSNISYNTLSTLPGSTWKTTLNVIGGSNNTIVGNYIAPYSGPVTAALFVTSFAEAVAGPPDLALLLGAPSAGSLAGLGSGAVPEPSSWVMLIVGFAGVGLAARRTTFGRRVAA